MPLPLASKLQLSSGGDDVMALFNSNFIEFVESFFSNVMADFQCLFQEGFSTELDKARCAKDDLVVCAILNLPACLSELLHQVLVLLRFFLKFAVISGIGGVAYFEYVDSVSFDGCFPSLPCKLGEIICLFWLEALNNHDVRSHFPEVLTVCVGKHPLWYSQPLSS